jgi:hypothetical protein
VAFDSDDVQLPAVLHLPSGPGPHPVVVLLHGFPGTERNFDLAQALRRCGYASVVFHYRGSWGTGGTWSWTNALDDAARVCRALRQPGFAADNDLDRDRLALVGHSMGGFVALMTAASDASVSAVASVAGFDFGVASAACRRDAAAAAGYESAFDSELLPLRGTTGRRLVDEMVSAGEAWSLRRLAPELADRAVLLIGTTRDPVTPADEHHRPVVEAWTRHPVRRLEHHVFDTDHQLSDHREELADTVRDFLDRRLGADR